MESTSQGPMPCGSFSHVGTFETILQRLCRAHDLTLEHNRPTDDIVFHSLDIRVVAIYGSEDHPIGAERRFRLHMTDDKACTLAPVSVDTNATPVGFSAGASGSGFVGSTAESLLVFRGRSTARCRNGACVHRTILAEPGLGRIRSENIGY